MTKRNFLHCIENMPSPILRLDEQSNGWVHVFCLQILCSGEGAPRKDHDGRGIGTLYKNQFVVATFLGGYLNEPEKNASCKRRADKSLAKFQRWLQEVSHGDKVP